MNSGERRVLAAKKDLANRKAIKKNSDVKSVSSLKSSKKSPSKSTLKVLKKSPSKKSPKLLPKNTVEKILDEEEQVNDTLSKRKGGFTFFKDEVSLEMGEKVRNYIANPVKFDWLYPKREEFIKSLEKYSFTECNEESEQKILSIMKETFQFYDELLFEGKLNLVKKEDGFKKSSEAPHALMFYAFDFKITSSDSKKWEFTENDFCFGSCDNILESDQQRHGNKELFEKMLNRETSFQKGAKALASDLMHVIVCIMEHEFCHFLNALEKLTRKIDYAYLKDVNYLKDYVLNVVYGESHGKNFWTIYESIMGIPWPFIQYIFRHGGTSNIQDYHQFNNHMSSKLHLLRDEKFAEEYDEAVEDMIIAVNEELNRTEEISPAS